MTYRLSCYECPFASVPRQGDITLADFWGVDEFFPELETTHGVSLILSNTQKGSEILNKISAKIELQPSYISDAAKGNGNLVRHTPMPKVRLKIFDKIRSMGYDEVAKTDFRPSNYYKLRVFYKFIDIVGFDNYKRIRNLIRRK